MTSNVLPKSLRPLDDEQPSLPKSLRSLEAEEPDISKTRSVISAPIKGLLKGLSSISGMADPTQAILGAIAPNVPQKQFEKVTEKVLPTRNETTEQLLERAGKLAPYAIAPETSIPSALAQIAGGAALGHLTKEEGVGPTGQGIAEIAGMGLPGLLKTGAQKAVSIARAPVEKMVSGLTKPRAVGGKLAERAVVTPETQEKAINRLNEEASKLTKVVINKELPLSKQIEEGVNFEAQFEKRFGQLEKAAERANPQIDITPLSDFMSKATKKFRGVPEPHPEAKKIIGEVEAFQTKPPTELKKLLRTYRSNNKKIKNIFETSRLTGKQQEYVDFLLDYNRSIVKSTEKTLPEDSAWMKEFKETNSVYKNYKDTVKTTAMLEPILHQRLTPASLRKFAEDKKLQQKLTLSLGENGAKDIVQIAQDLQTAEKALKKIPARKIDVWDQALPFTVLIPGLHVPGAVFGAKKSLGWAKRGYGWFLSTPKRRSAYQGALKALGEGNLPAYEKAAKELQESTKEQD